jgi:hypothetical protein
MSGPTTFPKLARKVGNVAAGSFAGNPKTYAVVFSAAYPDTNYDIHITGVDARSWSYSSKATTGFTIETNANTALTGEVSWSATYNGEA